MSKEEEFAANIIEEEKKLIDGFKKMGVPQDLLDFAEKNIREKLDVFEHQFGKEYKPCKSQHTN